MKYLFFFNSQPLLLCCVCCKIAIQDFMTGLHKKNKKNFMFYRRLYRWNITRRYFTESWKKFTGLCHTHRRLYRRNITRRYFTESCKQITGLCHNHRRYTDGSTDFKYRRNHRQIYAYPEAHACLTRVRLHKYRRIEKSSGIFELFLVHISINFRRYYRRNLMPLTTINFHR